MEPFTRNLRLRADELGISLAEAARRAGLSERRFGNYATGRREPDLATLVRIAASLGTTPDRLLSVGEDTAGDDAVAGDRERLRARIRAASHVLDEADLQRVAIMIDALAARRDGASSAKFDVEPEKDGPREDVGGTNPLPLKPLR